MMAAKNTCADCRHFTRASGWCSVYAKRVSRFAVRCDYGALCIRADRQTRRNDAERRDAGKPKRKYDAKKRAPKLKRVEADA